MMMGLRFWINENLSVGSAAYTWADVENPTICMYEFFDKKSNAH